MHESSNHNSGDLLPLAIAAEEQGVSRDYLRFLIFKRRLRAVKLGRDWFTTRSWMREYFVGARIASSLPSPADESITPDAQNLFESQVTVPVSLDAAVSPTRSSHNTSRPRARGVTTHAPLAFAIVIAFLLACVIATDDAIDVPSRAASLVSTQSFSNPITYRLSLIGESVSNALTDTARSVYDFLLRPSRVVRQATPNIVQSPALDSDDDRRVAEERSSPTVAAGLAHTSQIIERREIIVTADVEMLRAELLKLVNQNTSAIRAYVDNRVSDLASSVISISSRTDSTMQIASLGQKIDQLTGTSLTSIRVSGVTGLTDSDIPDAITISGSQTLDSLTLTGSLGFSSAATTTIADATINAYSIATSTASVPFLTFDTSNYRLGLGTTTPGRTFSVAGDALISGALEVGGVFRANSSSLIVNNVPTTAHTFPTWAVNAAGASATTSSLVINPASAGPDTNLLGLLVADQVKFLVDAEGDVFGNSLTVTGSVTTGSTTASSLLVENTLYAGDTVSDSFVINAGTVAHGDRATTTIPNLTVNAWSIATSSAVTPVLSLNTSGGGRVAIGTTSPTHARLQIFGGAAHGLAVETNDESCCYGIAIQNRTRSTSWDRFLSLYQKNDGGAGFGTNGRDDDFVIPANGGFLINTGSLGIGTTSPAAILSVQGSALISGSLTSVANITATGTLALVGTTGTSTIAAGQGFTIGTSQFVVQQTSGNVGIGTTSPFQTLSVVGSLALTGGVINAVGTNIDLRSTNGGSILLGNQTSDSYASFNGLGLHMHDLSIDELASLTPDDDNDSSIGTLTKRFSSIHIGTSDSSFAGSVGIGTTTPSARLSLTASGTGTGRAFALADSSNVEKITILDNGTMTIPNGSVSAPSLTVGQTSDSVGLYRSGTRELAFAGAGAAEFIVDIADHALVMHVSSLLGWSSGVPGSSSFDTLLRRDDADTLALARSVIPQEFRVYNSDSGTSDEFGKIEWASNVFNIGTERTGTATGRDLALVASSTEALRVSASSGNVGIGSTSPFGLLSVEQGTETASLWIGNTGSSTPSLVVKGVNGNGHVGVGTTDPATPLDVLVSSGAQSLVRFRSNGVTAGGAYITSTTGDNAILSGGAELVNGSIWTARASTGRASQINAGFSQVQFYTDSGLTQGNTFTPTQRMVLDTNGLVIGTTFVSSSAPSNGLIVQGAVGIGTTSPGQKLSVAGDILGNNVIGSYFTATSTTATSTLSTGGLTVGTSQLVVQQNSGRVGIRTAAPEAPLDIVGVNSSAATIRLNNTATAGTSVNILFNGSNQTILGVSGSTGGFIAGSVVGDTVVRNNGGNVLLSTDDGASAQLYLKTGGNVGIGTTSPGQKLSVAGDILGNNVIGSYFTATSTIATSTLSTGGFTVGTSHFVVQQTSGNVGIGTANPAQRLEVNGISLFDNTIQVAAGASAGITQLGGSGGPLQWNGMISITGTDTANSLIYGYRIGGSGSADLLRLFTDNQATPALFVKGTGNVGVGTTSPWRTFSVNGTAAFTGLTNDGTGYYVCLNTTTYDLATSTTACGASSIRFKENVEPLGYGLDTVLKLRPVSFDWKKDFLPNGTHQIGFIAEEVRDIVPEVIGYDNTGQVMNLDYPKLTAVLTQAVQELSRKLDEGLAALATSTSASGPTNAWSVSQLAGRVNVAFFGDINANQNALINVQKIIGMDGKWKIDDDGTLTAVRVITDELSARRIRAEELETKHLCIEDVCVNRDQLHSLLEGAGFLSAATSETPPPSPASSDAEAPVDAPDAGTASTTASLDPEPTASPNTTTGSLPPDIGPDSATTTATTTPGS